MTFSQPLRKVFLYLCLATLTQCSKCKKDDPTPKPEIPAELPPETQSGVGTCGCLVNGKAYATLSSTKCRGDWQGLNTLAISADCNMGSSYGSDFFSTGMLLNGRLQSGQVFRLTKFNQPIDFTMSQFVVNATTANYICVYQGNYIKNGQVELVKFDGVARIASGRFAFTLYEPGGCDTLRITNGRFDVKF